MIRHAKRRGEWVELQFMARAAAHNLVVSKPWGDSARYDFIVETRGRYARVQVKSTTYTDGDGYRCNAVSHSSMRKYPNTVYTSKEIDFFAFYIIPEDVWYIVPIAELKHARFGVLLNPYVGKNRYFPYLEAWHLLKGSRPRATVAKPGKRVRRIHACAEPMLERGRPLRTINVELAHANTHL